MSKKIKNKIVINSGIASIVIDSEWPTLIKSIREDKFLYKHIPSCRISLKNMGRTDAYLIIKKGNFFRVKLGYPHVYCYQPRNADVRGLISLAGYILERANNEKGVYSIHASVISKNGKAVVIFGGTTNLGKSIIAKTVADKYGWSFYSDEIALLSGKDQKVVGGVRVASGCDRFRDFDLAETKEKPKIGAFIHPHIDNGLSTVVKWEPVKFLWHLKEELARKIRGGSKAIDHFNYPLDSIDTFELAKNRLAFAKKLAKQISCYEVRGTPESISEAINKISQVEK
jgi:hypothetical protein